MKKLLALATALLVIGIAGATAMAENVGSQGPVSARIHTLGALGYGLAVSQSNPMEFELIKVGVAKVKVGTSDDENETNETADIKVGILFFGEIKYRLKDIVIGNGSVTANIYDLNGTAQKGSLSLNSYVKGDREVWAGTLTLDAQTYNAYVIQAPRVWKPAEKAESVKEYCKNNPESCKAVVKAVAQIACDPTTDGNCRNKIKEFCEKYPDDSRCKTLQWSYCKLHLEDANCRAAFIEKCKQNSTGVECDKLVNMYNKFIDKRVEVAKNAPAWLKNVRNRVVQRLQRGENIDADDTTAASSGQNSGGQ